MLYTAKDLILARLNSDIYTFKWNERKQRLIIIIIVSD